MQIQLVRNSASAIFIKNPKIHLVRPIIHLVQILALIIQQKFQKFQECNLCPFLNYFYFTTLVIYLPSMEGLID